MFSFIVSTIIENLLSLIIIRLTYISNTHSQTTQGKSAHIKIYEKYEAIAISSFSGALFRLIQILLGLLR